MNPAGGTARPSPLTLVDSLVLSGFLGLFLLTLSDAQGDFFLTNLERQLVLGALAGLLLLRVYGAVLGGRSHVFVSDVVVALWLAWELLGLLFAQPSFAAVEGAREALLALAAYVTGATALYQRRQLGLTLLAALALAAAILGCLRDGAFIYPGLWIPLLALGLCAAVALLPGGRWPLVRRAPFKLALALLALAAIGLYGLTLQLDRGKTPAALFSALSDAGRGQGAAPDFSTIPTSSVGDAAGRLRWQTAFECARTARQLFASHAIRGIGRGAYPWHDRARGGHATQEGQEAAGLSPWPHVAELGAVSLLLLFALYVLAVGFKLHVAGDFRKITSPLNLSMRAALLIWLVCGFIGAFLFAPLGLFVTFALVGLLRGQKHQWRAQPLASASGAGAETAPHPDAAEPAPPRLLTLPTLSKAAGAGLLLALFGGLCALPEIAAWTATPENTLEPPERTLKRLRRARTLNPLAPDYPAEEARLRRRQFGEAQNDYDERERISGLLYAALERNPLDERHYLALCSWLSETLNDPTEARRLLEDGLRECPGSRAIAFRLADTYERAGKYEKALARLEPFARRRPTDLELLKRLSRLSMRLGRVERSASLDERIAQLQSLQRWK